MKTLTCDQMGGPCDAKITGATKDEMMTNAMAHLEAAHPDMAATVKAMPATDPTMVAWNDKFNKDWEAAPEMAAPAAMAPDASATPAA
jgi:predicted small metal-binding protein